jgi:hypothetical protein
MARKAVRLTAALLAAVFLWLLATLPPRAAVASGTVDEAIRGRTVAGAFHVHSTRSDGAGDREAIAAAAARAGLQFVVITDHGDATRPPDAPAYLHGVLCIDAVEISTNGGHLVALDMAAAPYPLGGEPAAVVEDVLRLGGMPVAAHPDSPKAELSWKDWGAPVAGLEWLNLDSHWRDESRARLARVAFDSLLRPGPAMTKLLDDPSSMLMRWDAMAATRTVVALAAHDAHGGVARQSEEGSRWAVPGLASYEASFATFGLRVVLSEQLTRAADRDARQLLDALRAGRVFTAVDAIAAPAWVDYHLTLGGEHRTMGDALRFEAGAALTFRSTLPPGAVAVLVRDGVEVARSATGELPFLPTSPGVYRVEVRDPRWAVPWITTNPIYLRASGAPAVAQAGAEPSGSTVLAVGDPGRVEKDPASTADLTSNGGTRSLEFRLRSGDRASQYAALAVPLADRLPPFDRIVFSGRSSAPMRISVQARFDRAGGSRWIHSIYLSPESRQIVVPLERLVPADPPLDRPAPSFDSISSLLFVVDLTNAVPGGQGRFEISDLRLAAASQIR